MDMAVDPQGRATIAWGRWPAGLGAGWGPIEAVRVAADGTIGQVHQVSPGGQTVPDPPDRTRPELTLEGSTQRIRPAVAVTASCDEVCRLSGYGDAAILRKRNGEWMGVGRSIPLGTTTIADNLCRRTSDRGQALCSQDVRLKLTAPGRHRAKRALERGRRVVAHVTVEAEDQARNWTAEREKVRLTRREPKP
jgi:hypothetical protein